MLHRILGGLVLRCRIDRSSRCAVLRRGSWPVMSGKVDRIAGARDIDRSKRASAPDTVIRHREVAQPYVGVLARGARINRWPRGRKGRRLSQEPHAEGGRAPFRFFGAIYRLRVFVIWKVTPLPQGPERLPALLGREAHAARTDQAGIRRLEFPERAADRPLEVNVLVVGPAKGEVGRCQVAVWDWHKAENDAARVDLQHPAEPSRCGPQIPLHVAMDAVGAAVTGKG